MGKKILISYTAKDDKTGYENQSYRMSNALMDNIIAKAETLPQSSTIGDNYSVEYIDEQGKDFILSGIQYRLVMAFAKFIDKFRKEENTGRYIESISIPENFDYVTDLLEKGPQKTPLEYAFNLRELTQELYGSCGGKQMAKVREEIENLSKTQQVMKYKLTYEGKAYCLKRSASLISILKTYEIENPGKKGFNAVQMFIHFDDLFVLDILRRYTLVPSSILPRLKEKGVQTEMFNSLFYLLLRRRGVYVKKALKAAEKKAEEMRKKNFDEAKIQKETAILLDEMLTHKESVSSILKRMGDNSKYIYKTGARKGKPRTDRIREHFDRAVSALLDFGIIKHYDEKVGSDGETVYSFTFNEKWIEDTQDITEDTETDVQE